jgi:hypothetical protein
MRCDDYRDRMLDLVYGLLDPAEAAALESHAATCPACTAAMAAAKGDQTLLAKAAKTSFPQVRFEKPVERYVEPRRLLPRTRFVRWAVAAGIVLAVAGVVGPSLHSAVHSATVDRSASLALANTRQARERYSTEKTAYDTRLSAGRLALAEANATHDEILARWEAAEIAAVTRNPFSVEVTGPASAVAGAPNDYRIRATDSVGRPVSAAVEVAVADSTGKLRAEAKFEPDAAMKGVTFRLPASAWTDLPAGAGLTMRITAADATGQQSRLAEPINLLPPVYTTHLATDRPLYQPGETVFFRSLTLDRTRLLPPERDLALRYVLADPAGRPTALTLSGMSSPAVLEGVSPKPVPGPDGKPIRGVGCGSFALPRTIADGDYTLAVYELPADWTKLELPVGSVPLAKRVIHVHRFLPSRVSTNFIFNATAYRPGDTVVATLTAAELGKPLATIPILTAVTVDGKRVSGVKAPFNLDGEGKAEIRFDLPGDASLTKAVIKVTILKADRGEVVSRAVPLAGSKVLVDCFPEGGDFVAGLETRVYFRARTADGKPVEFRGELFDGEAVVAPAATVVDPNEPGVNRGFGTVTFTPKAGKRYVLRSPAGEFPLPAVKAEGVAMSVPAGVVAANQPLMVKLTTTQERKTVVVGAYTRGRPVATARTILEPGKPATVELKPEADAPGGVTRVTVFEEADDPMPGRKVLTPVAERLVFRKPTESLVLGYSATPGMATTLSIDAKTEAGRPTAAVLWAAVANESVFGRADDRTARGLPAHFYICGEVEKPDDLEFADFLLTDHPKAAESLDLLLGTQGWRRFAEQDPAQFRRTAPSDAADRLMVAVGSRGPVPAAFRPLVQRVAEKFQPQYRDALTAVESAEKLTVVDATPAETAKQQYSNALTALAQLDGPISADEDWRVFRIPVALGFLLVAGILAVERSRSFRRGDPERKYLTAAVVVAAGLAAFLIVTSTVSPIDTQDIRSELRQGNAAEIEYYRPGRPITYRSPAVAVNNGPGAVRLPAREMVNAPPDQIIPVPPATESPEGLGSPLESAATGRPTVRLTAGVESIPWDRAFREHVLKKVSAAVPPHPLAEKVTSAVPTLPPCVVREYAHAGPPAAPPGNDRFDATDTVLWHPVVVVPGTGKVELPFTLSAATGYRVLVAGHTLDGRVGTVTGPLFDSGKK